MLKNVKCIIWSKEGKKLDNRFKVVRVFKELVKYNECLSIEMLMNFEIENNVELRDIEGIVVGKKDKFNNKIRVEFNDMNEMEMYFIEDKIVVNKEDIVNEIKIVLNEEYDMVSGEVSREMVRDIKEVVYNNLGINVDRCVKDYILELGFKLKELEDMKEMYVLVGNSYCDLIDIFSEVSSKDVKEDIFNNYGFEYSRRDINKCLDDMEVWEIIENNELCSDYEIYIENLINMKYYMDKKREI